MKKILALTLSVLMIFALLAGCGGKAGKLSDEEMIVGRWQWTFDVGEIFTASFAMMGLDYESNKKAEMKVYFNFADDGTYDISVDQASAEKMVTNLTDIAKDLVKTMYPAEALEQAAAQEGVDVETLLDQMAAEAAQEMDLDELESEEGTYKFADGKLYFDSDTEEAFTYKLSAKKLELTDIETSEMDEEEAAMANMVAEYVFPIVMTKVS